ncbi:Augmin complex subunit dgt6 [Anthophora retusa]
MSIHMSLYKNVFLLMQVVPASFECTKHFKKVMFDKPNTAGFIHISHYLLSVYDPSRVQKMIAWPLINKVDEKRYRIQIKNYLEILANENADINFPNILMSHLVQAGGTRFLIIMWKLSEISLRAYLKRKYQINLLDAPNIGYTMDITKTILTTINVQKTGTISKFYEKTKSTMENFQNHIQHKSRDLERLQSAIFDIKENLEKFVPMLPVSPLIAARLMDIDDIEIIHLWKENIEQNIKILSQKNVKLKKLKAFSSTLDGLVSYLYVNCKIFNGSELPKINSEILPLCSINNIKHINKGLYINGCLVFHVLLSMLDQALKHVECYLKVGVVWDLSNCEQTVIEHCRTIKSMEQVFQEVATQVSEDLYDIQHNLGNRSINYTSETNFSYPISLETILTSPKLNFFTNKCTDNQKLLKTICVSPIQGKYKHLFTRYKRDPYKSPKRLTSKYDFNDSLESLTTNWKSPQKQLLNCKKNSPNKTKVSPRYSRLFCNSDLKRNYFKGNTVASTPLLRKSTTPKKSNTQTPHNQQINIDSAMKNIFDLSCKITNAVASLSKS